MQIRTIVKAIKKRFGFHVSIEKKYETWYYGGVELKDNSIPIRKINDWTLAEYLYDFKLKLDENKINYTERRRGWIGRDDKP